jgi:cell wall-associated NlpC family hydrolase
MEHALRPGDLFLTRGVGFLSSAIRFFTRRIGESRTRVNHVGVVVGGGDLQSAVVVEALRTVQRHRLIDEYGGTRDRVAVFRPTRLSQAELERVVKAANDYVGHSYGYGKIVLHALDWVLQGAYVFRRLGRMDDYPICSWLVAHAFGKAGVHFGVDAGAASPDDIWDYVVAHPGEFTQVRPLEPIPRGRGAGAAPERRVAA